MLPMNIMSCLVVHFSLGKVDFLQIYHRVQTNMLCKAFYFQNHQTVKKKMLTITQGNVNALLANLSNHVCVSNQIINAFHYTILLLNSGCWPRESNVKYRVYNFPEWPYFLCKFTYSQEILIVKQHFTACLCSPRVFTVNVRSKFLATV